MRGGGLINSVVKRFVEELKMAMKGMMKGVILQARI